MTSATKTTAPDALPMPPAPDADFDRIVVNASVVIVTQDDLSVVWVDHAAWHRFPAGNKVDRRIVGAQLVVTGLARASDVVRAMRLNRDTLYRDRKLLTEGGIQAFADLRRGPKGPSKVSPELRARAKKYYREGVSKREIGRRLGLSEGAVRLMLKGVANPRGEEVQHVLIEEAVVPVEAPDADVRPAEQEKRVETETTSEVQATARASGPVDTGASSGFEPHASHPELTSERDLDRTLDRVLARFGLIDEAEVRYVSGEHLRSVGALLILPALVGTGFFEGLQAVYGKLKNGFYGLRHTLMTVTLMLALRLKRAEHLVGVPPQDLGRLLGLDRAPEVKTLRRRLGEIASLGKSNVFVQWFARHLAETRPDTVGFLYVDGHTRVYSGKRKVAKAYATRLRLALPASTDYWVHDAAGQPIFVVTGEVTTALTKHLLPIMEELQAGKVVPEGQRVTFLFDRGGWSAPLFKAILEAGHDFITYRKGKTPRYRLKDFEAYTVPAQDGRREQVWMLRDGCMRPGAGLLLRQITRREEDGTQIAIVTNRWDLSPVDVVLRLGSRWRQENYFKYANDEFALDALDTYRMESEDTERTVPNPARRSFNRKIRELRGQAAKLEAELGRAADTNPENRRPTVRGFKIAHRALRQKLAGVCDKIARLVVRRGKLPTRTPVTSDAVKPVIEHKHFMNAVKMAVYRAETGLLNLLGPHYGRSANDGRALLREAFRASGSLRVVEGTLQVTLDPMSAPRRSRAVAALCEELNSLQTRIPGTSLRLAFGVRETGRCPK